MVFYGIELFDRSDWKKDVIVGVLIGAGFIVANFLIPAIAIGMPSLSMSLGDISRWLVIGLVAPVVEEILFRGALIGFISHWKKIPLLLAGVISAVAFMIYHLTAYGASLAVAGAYLGALIFGLLAFFVTKWRNNLLPAIIMHSIFNSYLLFKMMVVIT